MMNARPAALHRHLDTAQAEVQARDGEAGGRREGKVLLLELRDRTSAKGTRYLSGWLGKARLVAFAGEPDETGHRVWSVYCSEPEPKRPQGDRP
jgi:hypothetical protein